MANPNFSPEDNIYNGPAREIANLVNHYHVERQTAALKLAEMIFAASPASRKDSCSSLENELRYQDDKFKIYSLTADIVMPPRNAFEKALPNDRFASETVWNAMKPQQQVKATKIRAAIASGPLKDHGVTEKSLRILQTEKNGQSLFALVHTGDGIKFGNFEKRYNVAQSYRSGLENDALFQIEVNGITYDSRQGMTSDVYDAKVADAQARGVVLLPDSKKFSAATGNYWTMTVLSGEGLSEDGRVSVRCVNQKGRVIGFLAHPEHSNRYLRVCPAIIIS